MGRAQAKTWIQAKEAIGWATQWLTPSPRSTAGARRQLQGLEINWKSTATSGAQTRIQLQELEINWKSTAGPQNQLWEFAIGCWAHQLHGLRGLELAKGASRGPTSYSATRLHVLHCPPPAHVPMRSPWHRAMQTRVERSSCQIAHVHARVLVHEQGQQLHGSGEAVCRWCVWRNAAPAQVMQKGLTECSTLS